MLREEGDRDCREARNFREAPEGERALNSAGASIPCRQALTAVTVGKSHVAGWKECRRTKSHFCMLGAPSHCPGGFGQRSPVPRGPWQPLNGCRHLNSGTGFLSSCVSHFSSTSRWVHVFLAVPRFQGTTRQLVSAVTFLHNLVQYMSSSVLQWRKVFDQLSNVLLKVCGGGGERVGCGYDLDRETERKVFYPEGQTIMCLFFPNNSIFPLLLNLKISSCSSLLFIYLVHIQR